MKYNEKNRPIQCMMTNSTCYKGTTPGVAVGVLWHSTGADNTSIGRYVQPSENDVNYKELHCMEVIFKDYHELIDFAADLSLYEDYYKQNWSIT